MAKFRLSEHQPKERKAPPLRKMENVKILANETEKDQAEKLGGKCTPNSGAMDGAKGDYVVGEFLFDSKETATATLRLSTKDFTKVSREAYQAGKTPAISIKLSLLPGTVPHEWVAIPLEKFAEILACLNG